MASKTSAVSDEPIDVLFARQSGFNLLDFAGPLEVLTTAQHDFNDAWELPAFEVTIAGGEPKVVSEQGIIIGSYVSWKEAHERLSNFDANVWAGGTAAITQMMLVDLPFHTLANEATSCTMQQTMHGGVVASAGNEAAEALLQYDRARRERATSGPLRRRRAPQHPHQQQQQHHPHQQQPTPTPTAAAAWGAPSSSPASGADFRCMGAPSSSPVSDDRL
ncbi:hypothetical protein B0T24DRAFT_712080 [Lasiosphaeria ovina]|uniref:Uncharacterized protein n=1 Tax=Lasiosphaeria ovina TaxID=92902 RepID=A0AAE0JVF4_9PEZI|nr:hypothetical protein B0T24DRAFT_712080 [Lasiosphaeria ovina]